MPDYNLADFFRIADTENAKIALSNLFLKEKRASYDEFVELVHRGINWVCQEIARNPKHWVGSEDDITVRLAGKLKALGFDAKHDQKIGGHCDITIEFLGTYLWLGEAKKVDSVDNYWINKGYLQLNTRYTTGREEHSEGGLIIYCIGPRSDKVLDAWREYFQNQYPDHEVLAIQRNEFWSRYEHQKTGVPIRVRHLTVSLHHDPQDR
jgi:hypothetical protein